MVVRVGRFFIPGLAATAIAASALAAAAQEPTGRSILLILDASGSMNQPMPDGRTRFEAARASVAGMLANLRDGTRVALRVYGHQSRPDAKNCDDTELVTGFDTAARNRGAMSARIASLRAQGYTPITLSLQRAAQDIANEPSTERMVVLISDGRETCKSDPCAAARALAAADAKLVVHTIGLGVDAAARMQLQCIAGVGRGHYFDANSSRELADRLAQAAVAPAAPAVARPAPGRVGYLTVKGIAEFGVPIHNTDDAVVGSVGTIDPRKELPPGIYSVRFANGAWTGVEIKAGETTVIEPAYMRIVTPAKDNLYLLDAETGEEVGSFFMEAAPLVALLPGRYSARSSLPFLWTGIELTAGRTTTLEPALARIVHRPADGVSVLYRIVQLDSGIEGNAVTGDDLSLPPGRYRFEDPDRAGSAVEIEIKAGETKEVVMGR